MQASFFTNYQIKTLQITEYYLRIVDEILKLKLELNGDFIIIGPRS